MRIHSLLIVMMVVAAAACGSAASNSGDDDPTIDAPNGSVDAPATPGGGAPGSMCSCDADCADDGSHDGVCIYGVCMTKASGTCASGGSQSECPTGSRCWTLDGSDAGPLCWPDCAAHTCGTSGMCDADGSCGPKTGSNCDATCGTACACTETSCGTGNRCVMGECVPDVMTGGAPGAGPGPTCAALPARDCTGATCGQLVSFNPRTNTAWDDYPLNGETAANQYRSYLRRDLMMLVGYATSFTACKTVGWTTGIGGTLGLGDMSEANGAIPGTSIGSPGHPAGTHVNGNDIDLAYYQTGTANNRLRPICAHMNGTADAYHCVGAPDKLDVWRTALFLGAVFESPRTRVIGVDGKAGPLILSALDTLCDSGWLSQTACTNAVLAYEVTNMGQGWYLHHHHHAHISLKGLASFLPGDDGCFAPGGCATSNSKSIPQLPSRLHRVRPAAVQ
ncbi:MAG: hypothetical protein H0T42_20040 [Deltaproteobacteria bacterium]|nr:hypothetical protein [Deltaproteobacteria bacterium]